MSVSTVKKVLEQRLIRGAKVVVGESFEKHTLRGKTLVVASKQVVPCKKGGRCAGNWCVGYAVFATDAKNFKKDKKLAWRTGANKICLTHLLDEEGELLLPPPAISVASTALTAPSEDTDLVTWEELACAAADQDLHTMSVLARRLKRENEHLARQVIEVQTRLIEQYQLE